ncbi:DUF3168 domain-containing protein [Variovorax sp.]|jgi:Protein of unknown function (DUF3168)|uniref:DUF3168 domain-containing protein n=1 Tax=Variovorax sp. TaxID=1871043 RepID=UPI0040379DFD
MYPPIFPTIRASAAVRALLGEDPVRFYQFGQAPQGVKCPYAVWRRVGGLPENFIDTPPDADSFTLQVDVYASGPQGAQVARNVALALRDPIERVAYITNWLGESTDPQTSNPTFTFQVDWIVPR